MLLQWFNIFYEEIKGFFDFNVLLMVITVGIFVFFVDYQILKDKKLKKEAKICRGIGVFYVLGGIGLYVVLKIF